MNLLVDPTEAKKEGEISDEEILRLVRRAQEKEPEAFGDLFEMLEEKLHRHAYFLSGNEQQALDLLQETMFEAWKHLSRYDGRARFFTWICSIMVHRHYDLLRRLRVRATAILRQAHEAQQDSVEHSPAHCCVPAWTSSPQSNASSCICDSMRANQLMESRRSRIVRRGQ
jgi:RNA polymerase sigma factor (sigma-70 family)